MKQSCGYAIVVAGLICMFSVAPGWGGGLPITNDDSDGIGNTGGGTGALSLNSGIGNTAYGESALASNTIGNRNTATGTDALASNSIGSDNTALGAHALFNNTGGGGNTATGALALANNTTGNNNIATGRAGLLNNTTGNNNTALGYRTLEMNTAGNNNTALGFRALRNSTGSNNIAVGFESGINLNSGDNNIYLGSVGPDPATGSESGTLRLGDTQTRVFIMGVAGTPVVHGSAVVIDSYGQLGVKSSSARYKRDIETMGLSSQKLLQLRPVTFTYKEDPEKVRQYGLIAEEVAKVYPELVTHTPKGEVQGVDYETLIPMLLNELQRQQQAQERQQQQLAAQQAELAALKAHQANLEAALASMQTQQAYSAAGLTHTASLVGLPGAQGGR